MDVHILEILQIAGERLLKFWCPLCGEEQMTGFPVPDCRDCGQSMRQARIDVSGARRRILTTSQRKRRAGLRNHQLDELLRETEHCCAYCNDSVLEREYHIEHIIPLSFGGSNSISNLVIACPVCNSLASNLIFNSFDEKRLYLLEKRRTKQTG